MAGGVYALVTLAIALAVTGTVISSVLVARPAYTAANLGAGAGIFKDVVGSKFRFRTLLESDAVTTTVDSETVTLDLSETGVVPGIYVTPTTITVNSQGRVLNITTDGGGGGGGGSSSLAGDVTGDAGSNTIGSIQGTPLLASSPASDSVLHYNGTHWTTLLSSTASTGDTLALRDANGNVSFGVTGTDSIQSNSPTSTCMGLGPTTVVNNPTLYIALSDPYYAAPTLNTLNTLTGTITSIGAITGWGGVGNALIFSPAGEIYTFDNNHLYRLNPATAATVETRTFTPAIGNFGGAFHANGDLYLVDYTGKDIVKYNFTDDTVAIFASNVVDAGDYPTMAIIGDWIYIFVNTATLRKVYIPNPTVTYVFAQYYVELQFYEPVRLFTFCTGGAVHLGFGIRHGTNDISFINKDNGNAYDLFVTPTSITSTALGVLQGLGSTNCFQTTPGPTSCSTGAIDMAYNNITRANAIYTDNIFANTLYPTATRVITLQNNANFASSTAKLGFNNDTFLSRASAGVLSVTSLTATSLLTAKHFVPTNAAIPTAAAGTGAGTGPTVTVTAGSTDCKMQITVLTGTSPTAGGNIVVVTYNTAFAGTVNKGVVFSPAGANAAALSGATSPYISAETLTTFTFTSGSSALAATTTYMWNFQACT